MDNGPVSGRSSTETQSHPIATTTIIIIIIICAAKRRYFLGFTILQCHYINKILSFYINRSILTDVSEQLAASIIRVISQINIYQITRSNIPEDSHLHIRRRENLNISPRKILPRRELNTGLPARSLVTILTDIHKMCCFSNMTLNFNITHSSLDFSLIKFTCI
jgi:hypothetical protein